MTKNVVTVLSYTSIKEVADILISKDFRALSIVYNDELVGIITTTDVIRYLLELYEKDCPDSQ